jgi:A/G-specific adenine glycosylase
VKALLEWYACEGRAHLPWRTTRNPYYTLVSEFMLQQTQVDRVLPKFEAFVKRFPEIAALAAASSADVVREWKGLGYNSRAVRLQGVAREVRSRFGGVIPRSIEDLRSLPGIGPYTAAAIAAFAYDVDVTAMDTNLRRVIHRLAFGIEHPALATAAQLDEKALELLPKGSAHDWNSALMDLGATLCTSRAPKCLLCPLQSQCAAAPIDAAQLELRRRLYAKTPSPQNAIPFERTTRFVRGRIVDALRSLPAGKRISLLDLHGQLRDKMPDRSVEEVASVVAILERDGLVVCGDGAVSLRE